MPPTVTLDLPDLAATRAPRGAAGRALRGAGDAVLLEGPLGAGKSDLRPRLPARRGRRPGAGGARARPSPWCRATTCPAGAGASFRPLAAGRARRAGRTRLGRGAGGDRAGGMARPAGRPAPAGRADGSRWRRWRDGGCARAPRCPAGTPGWRRSPHEGRAPTFLPPAASARRAVAGCRAMPRFRRYARLRGGPRPALLMDAPPPEDVRPFLAVARHIAGIGLSAPEIIAADDDAGFLLIEDFGDATHAALLDAGADPLPLLPGGGRGAGRAARRAAARRPARLGRRRAWRAPPPRPSSTGGGRRRSARRRMPTRARASTPRSTPCWRPSRRHGGFVHRDYFPANLMRLPDRAGAAAHRAARLPGRRASATPPTTWSRWSRMRGATWRRRCATPPSRATSARAAGCRPRPSSAPPWRPARRSGICASRRCGCGWRGATASRATWCMARAAGRCWTRALDHPATRPLRDFLDAHVPPALRRNPLAVTEPA